jgi:hypothetical protein
MHNGMHNRIDFWQTTCDQIDRERIFGADLPKPLKEFVQQVLAEHNRADKIYRSFMYANDRVKGQAKGTNWRRKGTRRALFWEAAVDKLIELTQDDPSLVVTEHHDTVSFIFDDAILVRLKKADIGLHTSNYPTPLAQLFDDPQADLFGFTGLQRVEAVYIPNHFDTEVLWCGIVARDGHEELWHFELTPAVAAPPVSLPAPVQPPATELAKLKTQPKDKKGKRGGNADE